jgi:hypothetical protein
LHGSANFHPKEHPTMKNEADTSGDRREFLKMATGAAAVGMVSTGGIEASAR